MITDWLDPGWRREVDEHIARAEAFAAEALSVPRWCHLFPDAPHADEWAVFDATGRVTRRVRGRKMRTWDGLYDEFAAAWQFGEYFGENLNAFDECMRDLNLTWPTSEGFVVIIADAEQFLAETPEGLSDVIESFELIVQDLAVPQDRADDDPLKQPPLAFDVVLVTGAKHRDAVNETWRAAGAPL